MDNRQEGTFAEGFAAGMQSVSEFARAEVQRIAEQAAITMRSHAAISEQPKCLKITIRAEMSDGSVTEIEAVEPYRVMFDSGPVAPAVEDDLVFPRAVHQLTDHVLTVRPSFRSPVRVTVSER